MKKAQLIIATRKDLEARNKQTTTMIATNLTPTALEADDINELAGYLTLDWDTVIGNEGFEQFNNLIVTVAQHFDADLPAEDRKDKNCMYLEFVYAGADVPCGVSATRIGRNDGLKLAPKSDRKELAKNIKLVDTVLA